MKSLMKYKTAIAATAFIVAAFFTAAYVYTCTCLLGDAICEAQGRKHDAEHPFFSELDYSFLKEPGWVLYPWASMTRGEEGSVGLKLSIDRDGSIQDRAIVISSGFPLLDQAALDSIETFDIDVDQLEGSDPLVVERIKITFRMAD